jgi:ubiquinone/menaquinone biosynthesis C-methylase UbiE
VVAHGRPVPRSSSAQPAEGIPFRDSTFDLVLSRVTIPYTNVPHALAEIHRVLRPSGRAWLVLHGFAKERSTLRDAAKRRRVLKLVDRIYVAANTLALHFIGIVFPRPWSGRYESVQTFGGMARLLRRIGFVECVKKRISIIVTAQGSAIADHSG